MLRRRERAPHRLSASAGIALAAAATGIGATATAAVVNGVAASGHPGLEILPVRVSRATRAPSGLRLVAANTATMAKTITKPASPAKAAWRLSLAPADPRLLRRLQPLAANGDGVTVANRLIAALRKDGYPLAHATVDGGRHTIVLKIACFAGSGPLSQYIPAGRTVTADRLDGALPLLSAAAHARDEHVDLNLDQAGVLTPRVSPLPGRVWHAGAIFSSYGPRYAGSDVLSGYVYAHVGGFDLSASVTRGLPGLTPKQSAGGGYLGENLSIHRPTPAGIIGLEVSHAHFLAGGPLLPLLSSGATTQIRLGDRYPVLAGHVWLRTGLDWVSQNETSGALGWWTTQKNLSAYVGADAHYRWRGVAISLRGSVWHGLAGSNAVGRDSPNILGVWSSHYSVERLRLALARDVGPVRLSGIFGWQHGSPGTPQAERAYIGGRNRGSSFFTGSFAGPSGYWWSAEVSKARPVRFRLRGIPVSFNPYAGVNGGSVSTVGLPSDHVAAVTFGARFQISQHVTGSIGWSHTLEQPGRSHQSDLIGFTIATRF